jgi:hypothetical protein
VNRHNDFVFILEHYIFWNLGKCNIAYIYIYIYIYNSMLHLPKFQTIHCHDLRVDSFTYVLIFNGFCNLLHTVYIPTIRSFLFYTKGTQD